MLNMSYCFLFSVWLTSGSLRGPVVMGGGLLPLLPLPLPAPPPPTIFLLQRPNMKKTSISNKNFPLLANGRTVPTKIYSNVYGFDVTKTTMVNKVPISAFSTSLSMVKGKKASKTLHLPKVSKHMRSKSNCFKNLKPTLKGRNKPESDKENIDKIKTENPVEIPNPQSSEEERVLAKEGLEGQVASDVSPGHSISKPISLEKTLLNVPNIEIKQNAQIGLKISNLPISSCVSENDLKNDKDLLDTYISETSCKAPVEPSDKCLAKAATSQLIISTSLEKPNTGNNVIVKEVIKPMEIAILKSSNPFDSVDKLQILHNTVNQSSGKQDADDDLQKLASNKKEKVEEQAREAEEDIAVELLGGWGADAGAPLPPLPSSPTAAFLLAFPLVCSGPRPDTPLNDNLQTPNICSMEHFTNFFLPKELSTGSNLPLLNQPNSGFSDCQSKSNDMMNEKTKSSWFPPQSNVSCLKTVPPRQEDSTKFTYKPQTTSSISSACIYSDMNICFPHTKSMTASNSYCLSESMFSYEHAPVMNNAKDQKNKVQSDLSKTLFHYDNLPPEANMKTKISPSDNNLYSAVAPYGSSVSCNNGEKINSYNAPIFLSNEANICKNEHSAKLLFPGVSSEFSPISKSMDIPFTFPGPNTSNIYTSCNTFNPFTTEVSTNLGLSCGNSSSNIRPKTSSNSYLSDFSSNIYTQSCNLWMEEDKTTYENIQKTDYPKKGNISLAPNHAQVQSNSSADLQAEFRFPLPVFSKSASSKPITSTDIKSSKNNLPKYGSRDTKFAPQDNKSVKSEFSSQKGTVNWMTSEVHSGHANQDMFLPHYSRNSKNTSIPNTSQYIVQHNCPIVTPATSISNKKSETYEQPFYHMPPATYVPQASIAIEDNQYSWSPSKLASLGDLGPAASCSLPPAPCGLPPAPCSLPLPTLVGDLALAIGEPKQTYQHLFLDQSDMSAKERKQGSLKPKDVFSKGHSQTVDMNSSNTAGSFLSVSQLMERRKDDSVSSEITGINKSSFQYGQKKNVTSDNQNKNFNYNVISNNKNYDLGHNNIMPFYPAEFPLQQVPDHHIPAQLKDHFNNKTESNKNLNKNTYSTEALLQINDTNYQQNRRQKLSSHSVKSYDASNLCIPANIHGNHHNPSNHPLQYEHFGQSQSNVSNSYPYPAPAPASNPPLYSTASFMAPTNMNSVNYSVNTSGFMTDGSDFSAPVENSYFTPKLEHCRPKQQNERDIPKYSFSNKIAGAKEAAGKHKTESCKKDSLSNKRLKKNKSCYTDNYVGTQDRTVGSISNTMLDDSLFGYFSSSQMHPYPAQQPLAPGFPAGQGNYRGAPSSGKPPSPNTSGTSLTNFNLSTIFPEINKVCLKIIFTLSSAYPDPVPYFISLPVGQHFMHHLFISIIMFLSSNWPCPNCVYVQFEKFS